MSKIRLAVMFGGETVEHEVSVITGIQLMNRADPNKYAVVPIYIDKAGQWWSGEQLRDIQNFSTQDLFKPTGFTPFNLSANKNQTNDQIEVAILCSRGGR